ncbi:MAG: sugar ABC transporter ATP-binding protein [Phycicoccus sp.]|nr:sugar ABC transporter ATP-binding protein [Phycicoccus sp.]
MNDASTPEPLLRVNGIGKSFNGTWVLQDVDFDIRPGEVHALMGENGAGKSTFMKILAGVYAPDDGVVTVGGEHVRFSSPAQALASGIGIIHQELNVIPDMSIADNLALGEEPTRGLGILDRRKVLADARAKLARVGADIDPTQPIRSLSIGMQQMVEIARAVAEESRILILDEPTAALTQAESERLFELIRTMRSSGMGLIYISHRMEEVWEIADRVTVFRDGRLISTRPRAQVTPEGVVTDMIGRVLDDLYAQGERHRLTEPLPGLQVRGLTDGRGIGPVDLDVGAGEVVGMFGLIGAGRTEIARLIFGADRPTAGTITIDGESVTITEPAHAIAAGIALLTEDRKGQGLIPDGDLVDNIGLLALDRDQRFGVLRRSDLRASATAMVQRLSVRSTSLRQSIRELSGGNQQKALIGRWLQTMPRVLILDEPTRGVDIGAKNEIYRTVNQLVAQSAAVLLISSDLPEVIGMSDRVLVVREGRIVADIPRAQATEEAVMLHATGVAKKESQ